MGVVDGQDVDAAVTNPAFINKNVNDIMPNILGFSRLASGTTISDIQVAVNRLYTATGANDGGTTGTAYIAPASTITPGQPYVTALSELAQKFDPVTGHEHTGSAGDGPLINLGTGVTGGPLAVILGGTGIASYSIGDVLYASATGLLSRLPIGSSGNVLGVVGGFPAWVGIGPQLVALTGTNTLGGYSQSVEVSATANCTINLPAATVLQTSNGGNTYGLPIFIKNKSAFTVSVSGHTTDTIDGATGAFNILPMPSGQWQSLTLYPNFSGNGWLIT